MRKEGRCSFRMRKQRVDIIHGSLLPVRLCTVHCMPAHLAHPV